MKYTKEELEILILEQNKPYSQIGELFGVSGSAIKKAAKGFGIKLPRRRKINPNECFSHPGCRKKYSLVYKLSDSEFSDIILNYHSWKDIGIQLGYKSKVLSSNVKDSIIERSEMLGMSLVIDSQEYITEKTKGELFRLRKNWQSASTAIRKDARARYRALHPTMCCKVCGYSIYTEVAHIKAVSDFSDDSLISEINSIDNLIELCPNHHWEFDNGILKL